MGFFKDALRSAIFNQMMQKKSKTVVKQTSLQRRAQKEKQELADNIRSQALFQSQQLLKIVNECAEIVNTTVNPEVFFSRYSLMLEHLEALAGLECTGIFKNSAELPSEAFFRIEEQFYVATNDFLDRSFEKAKTHADTLKTDKGKANAIQRYFDDMEKYIVHMDGKSLEYFDKMKNENI